MRVQVPPVLLGVLAVVAAVAAEAEHPLLEDRVLAVPQRQREAERLPVVADARHAVLVPPVGSGPRVVVREVVPGRAVLAVVLPYRPPRPLGQIGTPCAPVLLPGVGLGEPEPLGVGGRGIGGRSVGDHLHIFDAAGVLDHSGHSRRGVLHLAATGGKVDRHSFRPAGLRRTDRRGRPGSGWSPTVSAGTPWAPSSGLRTRRYHGLLVVAGETPAARRVGLVSLDPAVTLPSGRPGAARRARVGLRRRSTRAATSCWSASTWSTGCRAGGGGSATW